MRSRVPGEINTHGYVVAISGDWAAVGRPARGFLSFPEPGRVFVYHRGGGPGPAWSLHQVLEASNSTTYPNTNSSDQFGISVALSGERLLIGADQARGGAGNRPFIGQAYLFELVSGTWVETRRLSTQRLESLLPSDQVNSALARNIALGDGVLVATDSGGDSLNGVYGGGRAYIYELPRGRAHCPGVPGGPTLEIRGVPHASLGSLTLVVESPTGIQGGLLAATRVGQSTPVAPGAGGALCLAGPGLRFGLLPATLGGGATSRFELELEPYPFLAGETWAFQALCRWQGGATASNAVALMLE